MNERARHGLEAAVGLTLIGVQRWMSLRPSVEAELDRLGHGVAADASRQLGAAVQSVMTKLITGAAGGSTGR